MRSRKVLLLTYHFPPSGAVAVYRMLGLVRYLPRFGWQTIVIAPPQVPWEPEDVSLLDQVPADTVVERVPFATGLWGKVARYLGPESHWLWKAWPTCVRVIEQHRPEAVLTSSPPGCIHSLGRWVQKKYRLPWLADFRDPWITNHPWEGWSLGQSIDRWREARVMKDATALIANTPLNQQGWATAFPEHAYKVATITNGFDPERFAPPVARATSASESLTILHAGEFYSGRDPRPFFDALQAERLPVRVELLGRQTESICDFPAEIKSRGLDSCVRLEGHVPYHEAIERMRRADILLLVHTPGYHIGVPAKLYEYLGAGRPILALAEPDSDIAWVLRESRVLHRIASPRDGPAIRRALNELTQAVRAGEVAVPDPDARHQFTRERMAQRFAECLDACVPRQKAVEVPS